MRDAHQLKCFGFKPIIIGRAMNVTAVIEFEMANDSIIASEIGHQRADRISFVAQTVFDYFSSPSQRLINAFFYKVVSAPCDDQPLQTNVNNLLKPYIMPITRAKRVRFE